MFDSDMYFHIFVMPDDQHGSNVKSQRPATVKGSKHWDGESPKDPQIVVDEAPQDAAKAL